MLQSTLYSALMLLAGSATAKAPANSTYTNPILPGFHPDPSCIMVPELNNTFFCASSSFNAFPGIPIHASKDLINFKLISNALNRPSQLPNLAITNRQTSGIWASTIRYKDGTFYIMTTLVFDNEAQGNFSRWDNLIFTTTDPFNSSAWSDPVHLKYTNPGTPPFGYDISPFWDDDGTVYVTGSHPWQVTPGITQATINLTTGEVGSTYQYIWNGTGGIAAEGPHIYRKDGWYYLMIAEGGTGVNHMETIARSKNINGPYTANPANPILTNANTTQYFQTVGHADLFQDAAGNWWGVALSTRSGPNYTTYPMGRETVLTPARWDAGEWPVLDPVRGEMTGWHLGPQDKKIGGEGPFITAPDHYTFGPKSTLPIHFLHWRIPDQSAYTISPPDHKNTLRLTPSKLNLTGYDAQSAASPQTFVGRRQVDTLFTYSVNLDFVPQVQEEEAGITAFLVSNHHIDLGLVLLPYTNTTTNITALTPCFRFRTYTYLKDAPPMMITPQPEAWRGQPMHMELKAFNLTHFTFSAGPVGQPSLMQQFGLGRGADVSWGFTGLLAGVYATTNGGNQTGTPAYVSEWVYQGQGQFEA